MAILARLAFGAPVHLDQVPYEGIEHLAPDDLEYAREFGLGLKLLGTAERVDGGLSVRVHPAFLYAGHPLASVTGPFNAVTVESDAITEITLSGPGAGGPQTASAVLGDVVSRDDPAPHAPAPPMADLAIVRGRRVGVLPAPRGGRPSRACSPRWRRSSGCRARRSSRSCSRAWANDARLVMVMHPVLESQLLRRRRADRRAWTSCARAPRAIRVIEEEFE